MAEQQPELIEQLEEELQQRTEEPPMYRVILHNDDFTTKAFVVQVLVAVFHKALDEATALMWAVHRRGSGVAGVYAREIAETKVTAVIALAREHGFPLKASMEPEN